jgi:hypothetical protein
MADQRIDQLNAETTPAAADVLPFIQLQVVIPRKLQLRI